MKKISVIVIDGGPCSGKTKGIPHIAKALRAKGYIVLLVPEMATLLIQGGLSPDNLGISEFQMPVYELQVFGEALWLKYAKLLSEKEDKDVIVLCDRGRLSGAAYLPDFSDLLSGEYAVQAESMHKEYFGVLHLVTAADGAEEFYTCSNNAARSEDAEHARALDKKSREAWKGHSNVRVVANRHENGASISFDEKLELAVAAIFDMLNGEKEKKSTEELEMEAKGLLTEDEYRKLVAAVGYELEDAKKQVNSYFDTFNSDLNARDLMLRVREKKDVFELTLKETKDGGRLETNHRPLSEGDRMDLYMLGLPPNGNVKEAIARLGVLPAFLHQGDLTTYRIEIPYKGCKLALDRNKYLDKIDYEIEMERDSENADELAILREFLKEHGIEYRPARTKVKRFFKAKSEV